MPVEVERMVKKLEKHPEVETPWALATWMKKKGYKMPAKAGEEPPNVTQKIWQPILDKVTEEKKEVPKKAEEVAVEALPNTPKEHMELKYKPKEGKPTFIDTVPSGKGKSLQEWASEVMDAFLAEEKYELPTPKQEQELDQYSKKLREKVGLLQFGEPKKAGEKKKTPSIQKMHRDYITSPESLLDDWKPSATMPKIKKAPFAGSDEDMLVYPEEFKKGMKEETEHSDVVGKDKEALKKIVLAHLKEDPRYYSKLSKTMKAEEEGIVDKIKSTVKDLTSSPKPKEESHIPLTKKGVRGMFRRTHGASAEEEFDPTKIPAPAKAEEEDRPRMRLHTLTEKSPTGQTKSRWKTPEETKKQPYAYKKEGPKYISEEEDDERGRDYTTWQREKHEQKSKPLLKKVSEKLFGEEELRQPRASGRPSSIRKSMKGVPHEKDVIRHLPVIDPVEKKAEEDQTSDYLESLKTRKMPIGWKKPTGPKPESEADLPSERLSAKLIQKAEEELDMPQKEFDEDALNELYCFLRWMSDKGFKAEDGDKLEKYMDQYEVEKFAEEMRPPAQFQAPDEEEAKAEEVQPSTRFKAPKLKSLKPKPTKLSDNDFLDHVKDTSIMMDIERD